MRWAGGWCGDEGHAWHGVAGLTLAVPVPVPVAVALALVLALALVPTLVRAGWRVCVWRWEQLGR